MVLLPTLGKPTIPQFNGTGTFLFHPLNHGTGGGAAVVRSGHCDHSAHRRHWPGSDHQTSWWNMIRIACAPFRFIIFNFIINIITTGEYSSWLEARRNHLLR
jgi:hypothetical protein